MNEPIGVFDSGLGGISVLKELVKLMPEENFIYYGDSANAPYGTRTTENVRELTINVANRLIEQKAKAIVIACNTATSAAVRVLREMYPHIPVIGIEPAVKPALADPSNKVIAVMATALTLKEEKFKKLVERFNQNKTVISIPAPEIVEYVEKGITDSEELKAYISSLLKPYPEIDAIVLGCTHFPLVRKTIQEAAGENIKIYDGGAGTARETKRLLDLHHLAKTDETAGTIDFQNSDPDEIPLSIELFNLK